MGVEIERKFLVRSDGWRANVVSSHKFLDGLVATFGGGKVRIRIAEDRAWIAVKGERRGLARAEFEYEIPPRDAAEMLELCREPLIEKTRHCVHESGQVWSVDVHEGILSGLLLAEIELEREGQSLVRPSWLGREVTGDPTFSKRALLKHHAASAGNRRATAKMSAHQAAEAKHYP